MSKTLKIIILCLLLVFTLSSFCLASSEEANVNKNAVQATTTNEKQEPVSILNTDVYIANNNVVIENTVNGNVFVYGSSVTIQGEIQGDLFVLANNLTIKNSAEISGNIFAYATTITVSGTVSDIYAYTSSFSLEKGATVARDLKLYCNQATLTGKVKKDVYIATGKLNFAEKATNTIGGNLHYTAVQEMQIPEGAVSGEIKFTKMDTTKTVGEVISNYISKFLRVILYAIIIILLVTFFTSQFTNKITYSMSKHPFVVAGIGIASFIVVPLLALAFIITGFLTYFGIALLALYCLVLSITIAILGMAIGNYFANKFKNKTKAKTILLSIVSVIILWLLQQIPTFGNYVSIFTYIFGLGLFVFAIFNKKLNKEISE